MVYSPWSIRARWALLHHGVEHEQEHYLPMVGEPVLRARLGQVRGKVSVPILFDGAERIAGSKEIARHAERIGTAGEAPLFPPGVAESIDRWDAISETLARAGRGLLTPRLLASDAALRESLPRSLSFGPIAAASMPVARATVRYIGRKYDADPANADHDRRAMRTALSEIRAAITARGHLVGDTLTYADVSVVASLQIVRPCPRLVRLGTATHAAWTEPAIAQEHEDVLSWRDHIVERFHPRHAT